MNTKTNATDAYRAGQERLGRQLETLKSLLDNHAKRQAVEPLDWGFAGDLARYGEALDDIIETLGGAREQKPR